MDCPLEVCDFTCEDFAVLYRHGHAEHRMMLVDLVYEDGDVELCYQLQIPELKPPEFN